MHSGGGGGGGRPVEVYGSEMLSGWRANGRRLSWCVCVRGGELIGFTMVCGGELWWKQCAVEAF